MTNDEAIKTLSNDGCYECSYGCESPAKCPNGGCDVREAVLLAIAALERDRWISVEERLPEKGGLYIVYLLAPVDEYREELSYATEMRFDEEEKLWVDETESYNALLPPRDDKYCVTHWKKMPEPPKEET